MESLVSQLISRVVLACLCGTALAACQGPDVRSADLDAAGKVALAETCTRLEDTPAPLAVPVVDRGTYDGDYLMADDFRSVYPAPGNLAQVVGAWNTAYDRLLDRAAGGLSSRVRLVDAGGNVTAGFDEYIRTVPKKYREVRAQYESIMVGKTHCRRTAGEPFQCKTIDVDDDFEFVARKLVPAAIVSIDEAPVACGGEACMAYTVVQADQRMYRGEQVVGISPQSNHHVFRMVLKPDGNAFSLRESQWVGGKMQGLDATYFYTCDAAVKPFELPVR